MRISFRSVVRFLIVAARFASIMGKPVKLSTEPSLLSNRKELGSYDVSLEGEVELEFTPANSITNNQIGSSTTSLEGQIRRLVPLLMATSVGSNVLDDVDREIGTVLEEEVVIETVLD